MEDYRLTAVYKKEDAIISLYEDDDHDFIYISDSRDGTWMKVPEWDYDIDEYDFMYLEDGYDIFYMSMETHTGFWNLINLYYDEYDHIVDEEVYLLLNSLDLTLNQIIMIVICWKPYFMKRFRIFMSINTAMRKLCKDEQKT